MKPAVLVATTGWDGGRWAERLRSILPAHDVLTTDREGAFPGADDMLAHVRYALAWRPRQDTIDRLPALQVIFSPGAGVDHIFRLERLPDVPVVRIVDPDLTGRMCEYVVWQALHHLRRGPAYQRLQATGRWEELEQPAAHQLTVGIMGLGVLGAAAAELLKTLGFRLRAWTRSPRPAEGIECFHGKGQIDAFLGGVDILVSLLPLTPETAGLIDRTLIGKLRRDGPLGGPILINAGRGGSQVEADIAAALADGTLAGASLDVFGEEPLPAASPLWAAPNLVITPHVAAVSDPDALAARIGEQILAFERGEKLRNRADPRRGY